MTVDTIAVGDVVQHKGVDWKVTDIYERGIVRHLQASLQGLASDTPIAAVLTHIPLHELVKR